MRVEIFFLPKLMKELKKASQASVTTMSPHIVQCCCCFFLMKEANEQTIKKQRKTFYSHLHISARGDSCEGIYVVHKTITTERASGRERGKKVPSHNFMYYFFIILLVMCYRCSIPFHLASLEAEKTGLCYVHIEEEWSRVEHEHITGKLMLCEHLGMTKNIFLMRFF